ncbi:MAG: hypothetical protein J6P03_07550, partial [Opitutales bacterium]|nr:hypothetical protein [Opitutales bacterium]
MDEIKTGSLPTPENSGENSKSGEFKKYLKILKNAGRKTRVEVERLAKSGKFSEAAIAMAW